MKKFLILSIFTVFLLASACTNEPAKEITPAQENPNTELEQDLQNAAEPSTTAESQNETLPATTAESQETQSQTASFAVLKTNMGDIKIKFYAEDAPKTVENFVKLAKADFYDGVKFHRVIKGFMIQTGDPNSKDDNWSDDGKGGPGYTFADETNSHELVQGSVAMANSGPNTNGSQFFIMTAANPLQLQGYYTNFGEVVEGMDVALKIEQVKVNENDHPEEDVVINDVELID